MQRLTCFLVACCAMFGMSSAKADSCRPDINTCPYLYTDNCTQDVSFRETNAKACLNILANVAEEAEICATFDPSSCPEEPKPQVADCTDPAMEPHQKYFCDQGYPQCPSSVPMLLNSYDTVLAELVGQITPYEAVLNLAKSDIPNLDALCAFSRTEFEEFVELAERDKQGLQSYSTQLALLGKCRDLMDSYLNTQGAPPGVSDQAWAEIIVRLTDDMKVVRERQGATNEQIKELGEAPAKIIGMRSTHSLACG